MSFCTRHCEIPSQENVNGKNNYRKRNSESHTIQSVNGIFLSIVYNAKCECTFAFINEQRSLFITGQVDYTEFVESAKSAENHNFLSLLIKSKITRILFSSNSAFSFAALYLNKNAEFAEGFKKFHLLYQCWIVVTVHRLIACYQCLYTPQITFQTYFYLFELFSNKKLENGTLFAEADISRCSK